MTAKAVGEEKYEAIVSSRVAYPLPMPRSAEETRLRILDAAYRAFRRRGYSRIGVHDIAAAARVTKRTLYYHFKSKDALLAAVTTTLPSVSTR